MTLNEFVKIEISDAEFKTKPWKRAMSGLLITLRRTEKEYEKPLHQIDALGEQLDELLKNPSAQELEIVRVYKDFVNAQDDILRLQRMDIESLQTCIREMDQAIEEIPEVIHQELAEELKAGRGVEYEEFEEEPEEEVIPPEVEEEVLPEEPEEDSTEVEELKSKRGRPKKPDKLTRKVGDDEFGELSES